MVKFYQTPKGSYVEMEKVYFADIYNRGNLSTLNNEYKQFVIRLHFMTPSGNSDDFSPHWIEIAEFVKREEAQAFLDKLMQGVK